MGIRKYFLRRVTRLEPPYIVLLIVRSAIILAIGLYPFHFVLGRLAASILYAHNTLFGISSRIEAASWTLEIEAQFYCLAPLLSQIFRIPRALYRRLLLAAAIVSATPLQRAFLPGWYGPPNAGAFNLSLLAFIQFFLVGFLVADLYVDGWERIPRSWLWDFICPPLCILMFWLALYPFRFLGPLILPVVLVGAFKGAVVPRILRNPLITIIGGMCYSIYLTHRTIISAIWTLLYRLHSPLLRWPIVPLALSTFASITIGSLFFVLIERPCMDPAWPRRLLGFVQSRQTRERNLGEFPH